MGFGRRHLVLILSHHMLTVIYMLHRPSWEEMEEQRERERERERVRVSDMCMYERERVCVCVREREEFVGEDKNVI